MIKTLFRAAILTPLLLISLPASGQQSEKRPPASASEMTLSFAPVSKRAAPAVVNVNSSRVVRTRPTMFDLFFGEGAAPRNQIAQSLGSGVIVDPDGVIVTNNHVVQGAQELTVSLADRREFDAEVLLSDERTDLAILKIDAGGEPLPYLDFAPSNALEVGDLVLAIGNPFGVGQTVTQGIVSALARTDVGLSDYNFFIQTDAAINPGNSGGALLNMDGDVVGINTAIFSRSGGSNGIGFAIPSEMVQTVVQSALNGGEIVRPWLGASLQAVTSDLAQGLSLSRPKGALVTGVYDGGPANDAGLEQGDIVTAIDDSPVNNEQGVRFLLATRSVGDTAMLTVIRDGREQELRLRAEAPSDSPQPDKRLLEASTPLQGATVANLSPAYAEKLGLDPMMSGVIVTKIVRGSAADYFGFQPGDKLVQLGEERVETTESLSDFLNDSEGARTWPVAIERGGRQISRTFRL